MRKGESRLHSLPSSAITTLLLNFFLSLELDIYPSQTLILTIILFFHHSLNETIQ